MDHTNQLLSETQDPITAGQLADPTELSAPLRPVGGVEEIQVVGAIPDVVFDQCGFSTRARSVWMHPDVVRKIERKRPGVVDFTLNHLSEVILQPHYCGRDPRDAGGRRIDLVHLVGECGGRPLFVSVKLVHAADAATGDDELWVSTAHPLPPGFLTQARYASRFRAVGS